MAPDLTTSAGIAFVVFLVMEVITRTLAWNDATKSRFAPLAASVVGIALALAATLGAGADVLAAAITGLIGGLAAVGIHDIGGGALADRVAGTAKPT